MTATKATMSKDGVKRISIRIPIRVDRNLIKSALGHQASSLPDYREWGDGITRAKVLNTVKERIQAYGEETLDYWQERLMFDQDPEEVEEWAEQIVFDLFPDLWQTETS